jgi:S-adenosylmethionine:tRNA ribosyltransferase-isomerase
VRTSDFDYELPEELIAQAPAERRDGARLLVLARGTGKVAHRDIGDLPALLREGDLLVVNDTKVLPARLFGRRTTGGKVEALLLEPSPADGEGCWSAMVRAGGSLQPGEDVDMGAGALRLVAPLGSGRWVVRAAGGDLDALMEAAGKLPLPPYIRRDVEDERDAMDRVRYQTVFARRPGAIAAPTAGLHLTEELLETLAAGGVGLARVTLHVGVGTFLPIRSDDLDAHDMHEERYEIGTEAAAAIRAARSEGRRIVAVGTTTVRTLEAAAAASPDGLPQAGDARTDLFIRPGHRFRCVDALLTNFHLPRSTLLCLVSALAGRERVLAAYREAVRERYRFYSYGDAMLIA